jgi:hypothetical protein
MSDQLVRCSDMSGVGSKPDYNRLIPSSGEHPSRQRLADRAVQTVVVLAFRATVAFGSYGVKSAVLSVRR